MAYKAFPFTEFGGLDLRSAPDESACIDMLNVDLDRDGIVRSRDFFGTLVAGTTLANPALYAWPGEDLLVVTDDTDVRVYTAAGTAVAAAAAAPNRFHSAQPFGTTTASYMYLAVDTATAIRRLTTAGVLSAPAGMPSARYVGRQATDNRLVAANIGTIPAGATSTASGSLVHFSDAGAPETWTSTSWVQLDPGDGEDIVGMANWGDLLIVFKQTKFYVFYGNSTDASGNPVFNYRTVRHGAGRVTWGDGAAGDGAPLTPVTGRQGVYFMTSQGVFVTTGGTPREVSGPIRPLFRGRVPSYFTQGRIIDVYVAAAGGGRVYFAIELDTDSAGGGYHLLVYDEIRDLWLLWHTNGTPLGGIAALEVSLANGPGFLYVTPLDGNVSSPIWKFDESYSSDATGSHASRYRAGFSDMGIHDEKRIAEWDLWGTGTVNFQTSRDFGSLDTATSFTLGTSPAIARQTKAKAKDGSLFSWQVGASSGAWSLQRAVAQLSHPRPPGTKTP